MKKKRKKKRDGVLNNSGRLEKELGGMQNEGTDCSTERRAGPQGGVEDDSGGNKRDVSEREMRGTCEREEQGSSGDVSMASGPAEHLR